MNLGNMGDLFKLKGGLEEFLRNHPYLPAFAAAVKREGVRAGSIVEVRFTTPEGKTLETNLRVKEEDLAFLDLAEKMMSTMKPEDRQ